MKNCTPSPIMSFEKNKMECGVRFFFNAPLVYQSRPGDVGMLSPTFQAGNDGLPCVTKSARAGVCVGGGTRQRHNTLFPKLGAVVRQRSNALIWAD